MPVLVVHHEQDGCRYCLYGDVPRLMQKLTATPRKEPIAFRRGENVGNPCEALSYNGLRNDVVALIAA